ncbi:uncharacterized protein OCT59_027038 [Rhizophagus irregularis]|uniref:uncharacterized protein n=1 Tax=Rhizophagus irregularis TaxID=588596 RepID=UPI00331E5F3D|nr:hypothetical protein OCT59_027038 [Rhizophagus irregularis]
MLENTISEWIRCINKYYELNRDGIGHYGNYNHEVINTDNQLRNDMLEFIKANEALVQKQANSSIIQSHPQAYCVSRTLTGISVQSDPVQEKTECLDCMV